MISVPGLTKEQLAIVNSILSKRLDVKLFGSRVIGNFRDQSDLDVCILTDIARSEVTEIVEAFEESNLPFTVDVVLYKDCNYDFKVIIDSTGVLI